MNTGVVSPRSAACFAICGWRCGGLARDESVLPLLNGGAIGILIFSTPPTHHRAASGIGGGAASALLLYEVPANEGCCECENLLTFLKGSFHSH